jgi:hypothetical protein
LVALLVFSRKSFVVGFYGGYIMAVERLNYFTGLFLNASDFKLEQNYHLLMRRRLNFGLFLPGVLFGLDVDREAPSSVRVDPGMAIDRHEAESQGREIVLTESRPIDLSTFANGAQVYIVISYNQAETTPQAPLNLPSRITEEPIIEPLLAPEPPEPPPGDRNLQIILAKVTVGDLSDPDLSERQLAQLRLGGGGGPTITSLSFSDTPRQDSSVRMTINGANLAEGTPQVRILDTSSNPDAQIDETIDAEASSNTALVVDLVITPTAALGNRRVRVQTDRGTVTTDPVGETAFEVFPPGPEILGINPIGGRQTVAVPVTITGHNLAANPVVTVLLNDATFDPNVPVTRGAVTPDSITATLTITGAAAAGGRRVRIQTAGGGDAISVPNFFTVRPLPVIKSYSPTVAAPSAPININGSDIRSPSEIPGNATATVIEFVDPSSGNSVLGGAIARPDVSSDVGPQQITVTVPVRGSLPEVVQLTLKIDNVTVIANPLFRFL